MKNFLLAAILLLSVSSCKKSSDICYVSVTSISGFYKITKMVVSGTDITSTYLDSCRKTADLQLYKEGKSAVYEETNPNCSGSGSGTWDVDVIKKTITIKTNSPDFDNIDSAAVSNFSCSTTFDISGMHSGAPYVMTLTKLP